MAQYLFGSGAMFGIPTADANGNAITNPTPQQFGVLQDVSIDISFETKTLHGQGQFPVAVGRGKGKISGKAKAAQVNGTLYNSLFFGQTLTSGIIAAVNDAVGAVIPSTPFTITPTIPGSGTWSRDLGVRDANGIPMTRVASAPITGQYSVSAGVYTFAAADTSKLVFINYEYTATSTTAKNLTVKNLLMGYAPTFSLALSLPFNGKSFYLRLPCVVSSKLSFAAKNDDFSVPEIDLEAFADTNGDVAYIGTSE